MDSTEEKLPLPKALSPSRALDYRQCPQMFYYKAIERRFDPATVPTAKGTLVHDALDKIFELPREERVPEAAVAIMREIWPSMRDEDKYRHLFTDRLESDDVDARDAAAKEEALFLDEAEHLIRAWYTIEDPRRFDATERETKMFEKLGPVKVVGILDRLDSIEPHLYISDYKTGKVPQPRYQDKAFFGMRVYAAMWRARTGNTPTMLRLVYPKGPVVLTKPCDDRVCDKAVAEMTSIWESIQQSWRRDEWKTQTGPLCNWCSYQDICPAWAPSQAERAASAEQDRDFKREKPS